MTMHYTDRELRHLNAKLAAKNYEQHEAIWRWAFVGFAAGLIAGVLIGWFG